MLLNLIKTYGGKGRIWRWVVNHFPMNHTQLTYIEPYGGGGSVLLNKPIAIDEYWNDIDIGTYAVFYNIQQSLYHSYALINYKDFVFNNYKNYLATSLEDIGTKEFVLRNMSRSGMKKDFAWSKRLRGGQPGDANAWANKINGLPKIEARLKNVKLSCKPALDILREKNSPNALAYLDPPYVSSTRVSKKVYIHEMELSDHTELLNFIMSEWKGKAIISGYDHWLYNQELICWNKVYLKTTNNAGQTKTKSHRIEVLWKNY